jgi:hypothetical protein
MADSTEKKDMLEMGPKTLPNMAEKASLSTSPAPTPAVTPQPRFKFLSTAPQRLTWYSGKSLTNNLHPFYFVNIAIEHPDLPQGALICSRVPREDLFKLAPKLRQYLDVTNTKIILPANSVDEETVHDVITAIVAAEKQKTEFTMRVEKTPVTLIKIHAVLVLFGTKKEAEIVRLLIWESMAIHELSPQEVDWIWDTFGVCDSGVEAEMELSTAIQQHDEEDLKNSVKLWKVVNRNKDDTKSEQVYVALYAKEYVDKMAYQILNLEALGKLNNVILMMVLDRCTNLKKVLGKRKEKYGLAPGYKPPSTPLDTPIPTSSMASQQANTIPKVEAHPTSISALRKLSTINKSPPHRTPAMEAALNRKASVLNFSRATVGITVDKLDDRMRLPHDNEVLSWVDQDPNKPSKLPSSFLSSAPIFTPEGFMKSVEVSMKDDEELNVFGQTPKNALSGPTSFQSNASSHSVSGSNSNTTEVPTGSQNGGFSVSIVRPSNTLANLSMVDQTTQTGASLNAIWGFGSFFSPQQQLSTGNLYPSTVAQSFPSSIGSTTVTSTPTQSFINQAAFGGFGGGQLNGTGNAGGGVANANESGGGDNMFAFQSNGSFGARKKAKPRGRLGGRR